MLKSNSTSPWPSLGGMKINDYEFDKKSNEKHLYDRLEYIKNREYGNDLPAIERKNLEKIGSIFKELINIYYFDSPRLYPTGDGEIQAEWVIGNYSIDIVFDFETNQSLLIAVEKEGEKVEEYECDFIEDPNKLIKTLLKFDKSRG